MRPEPSARGCAGQPAHTPTADTLPTVRAVRAVLDDQGRRIVVGRLDTLDGGRWFCEACGLRSCAHVRALLVHVAEQVTPVTTDPMADVPRGERVVLVRGLHALADRLTDGATGSGTADRRGHGRAQEPRLTFPRA